MNDGTYKGVSSVYTDDEDGNGNGYGEVYLAISNGEIVSCEFHTYEENGTPKDAEYGKQNGEIMNQDYYNKAQKAVAACAEYAKQLVQTGELKEVDAITGASINYSQFKEAVKDALKQAKG